MMIRADEYPAPNASFVPYFQQHVAPYFTYLDPSNVGSLVEPYGVIDTPAGILNASIAITSNGHFTCFDLAKAVSGVRSGFFKEAYSYVFNRTYATRGYTRPWCDAPITSSRPNGDPDAEYFKCHGAEQLFVFGTLRRNGYPDRDGLDVPFAQLAIDYWASFARTGDPNPEAEWLKARGYFGTLEQVNKVGRWEAVNPERPTMRVLQWDGKQADMIERERCVSMGIQLDILE